MEVKVKGRRLLCGSGGRAKVANKTMSTCCAATSRPSHANTRPRPASLKQMLSLSLSSTSRSRSARTRTCEVRAGSDLSSLFDGTPTTKKEDEGNKSGAEESVKEVELNSELGLSYELLRDLLEVGEWEKADDETRLKLIEMAGPEAESRGWVYFTEVKDIPVADLQTVDKLWSAYSKGRYGYSIQKKIWTKNKKVWTKFFVEIDWVQGENNAYRKWPLEFFFKEDAKKGHLPLTNCLRGTQLFQAVLEHPAFEEKKKKVSTSIGEGSVKI